MATIGQLEAALRPYKIALIKAFGLDPDHTSSNLALDHDNVTFLLLHGHPDLPPHGLVRGASSDGLMMVDFDSRHWTAAQRRAVTDYIGQFPGQS